MRYFTVSKTRTTDGSVLFSATLLAHDLAHAVRQFGEGLWDGVDHEIILISVKEGGPDYGTFN